MARSENRKKKCLSSAKERSTCTGPSNPLREELCPHHTDTHPAGGTVPWEARASACTQRRPPALTPPAASPSASVSSAPEPLRKLRLFPLRSLYGCLARPVLPTECPRCSPACPAPPGHPFLRSWLGATERTHPSPCSLHPSSHVHRLPFKTEDPWPSQVSVTPKATRLGGGSAGAQPGASAVGRRAALPSEMPRVTASGSRVAPLLCPGGYSAS